VLSQQAAHVNVVHAVSASFCMNSSCTTYILHHDPMFWSTGTHILLRTGYTISVYPLL